MMSENLQTATPAVEFFDILEQYSSDEDLKCTYKYNDYTPRTTGDRIVIFKLGWTFIKDYVLFEWAPHNISKEIKSEFYYVVFSKEYLPKNTNFLYQICYITGNNEVRAATSPFQFVSASEGNAAKPLALSYTSLESKRKPTNTSECDEGDKELKALREERDFLRESLKAAVSQRSCDKDIENLRATVEPLVKKVDALQFEVNELKLKITQCGVEYKNLYMEKHEIKRKYEKLKNKSVIGPVENFEKPQNTAVEPQQKIVTPKVLSNINFDIDQLQSIPPFPFPK